MKKILNHKFPLFACTLTLCYAGIIISSLIQPESINTVVTVGLFMGAINLLLVWFVFQKMLALKQQTSQEISGSYLNAEAIISINNLVKPIARFPPMSGRSVSSTALLYIYEILDNAKPELLMELGAGVSTLVLGYWASRNNAKLISVENNEEYLRRVLSWVDEHKLQNSVDVLHSPLVNHDVSGQVFLWYEASIFERISQVDFLFVDGPKGELQALSRYPAMPMLVEKLSDNAVVALDDAARNDEQKIVRLWNKEFPEWRSTYKLLDGKGMTTLHK